MTSFRYHVVSLAAVFLALAIGIVLGSGPMRTALVQSLGDQVDTLEQQADDAASEAQSAQEEAAIGNDYATELEPFLLSGALSDVNVAIVSVADPADSRVEAAREALVTAGATISADVTIEDAWTDSTQGTFRTALAEQLADQISDVDASTASSDRLLAHALAQSLVPTGDASDTSSVLLDLLKQADLVTGTVTGSADAIVVVAGDGDDDEDVRAAASDTLAGVVGVLDGYVEGTVAAQGASATGDLASALRNVPDTSEISSVTEVDTVYGRTAAALALVEQIAGGSGHYGAGSDGTLLPSFIQESAS
ncbi:copper transporter [Demequina salsinemoris]|uniref:copper transporter n=1 Tax=Demequina salsinemoris TaxID=577470 RepID=UPI000784E889|nr:copper transporter [Demequina salsinemoris]